MPDWQPQWSDVDFDHGAAAVAIAELDAAATVLTDTGAMLHRAAAEAKAEWRGRYREAFDVDERRLDSERAGLVDAMRLQARRIFLASEEARVDQRRRESDRERWQAEARAEADAAARAEADAAARAELRSGTHAAPVGAA